MYCRKLIQSTALFLFAVLLISPPLKADDGLDVTTGAYYWYAAYSGDFSTTDYALNELYAITLPEPTDVESDLDMQRDGQYSLFINVGHNKSSLPQIRFAYSSMKSRSKAVLTKDIIFNSIVFRGASEGILVEDVTGAVQSQVNLSHGDITAYYQIWQNPEFDFDLGLTVRRFNGFVGMRQPEFNVSTKLIIDEIVPLLHARLLSQLPIRGLSAHASMDAISYQSNRVIDFNTALNYSFSGDAGVALGYRNISVDLTDLQGQDADLSADGPYLALNWRF